MNAFTYCGKFVANKDETTWVDCTTINVVSISEGPPITISEKSAGKIKTWGIVIYTGNQEITIKELPTEAEAKVDAAMLLRHIDQVKYVTQKRGEIQSNSESSLPLKPSKPVKNC